MLAWMYALIVACRLHGAPKGVCERVTDVDPGIVGEVLSTE